MPATVKNCAFQCATGVEEQGVDEVLRQVLGTGGYIEGIWNIA